MIDLELVRAQFPALDTPWALLDNAGGTAPARRVIERVAEHMSRLPVQLGASYPLSGEAAAAVARGRHAAATLVGADPNEVVFGASSTVLAATLARALRPVWSEGDELIVTDLDHEANVGPWRALEATGVVVKEWRMRTETATLELEDLEPLFSERTRLVAFTHVSNVVGTIHDVRSIADRVRAAGALSCVDGVAFAPHRRVDVRALGVDFYLVSLYKVFGPHLGLLFGRRELLETAQSQNHFFVAADNVPYKFEPGNACYELVAGLPGILAYFETVGAGAGLERVFEQVARFEAELCAPLLAFLARHPRVRVVGHPEPDPAARVATICFTVDGESSASIPPLLDQHQVATRFGHFYAHRAIDRLGLHDRDGVVRISMVHYNTPQEVERLVTALDQVL